MAACATDTVLSPADWTHFVLNLLHSRPAVLAEQRSETQFFCGVQATDQALQFDANLALSPRLESSQSYQCVQCHGMDIQVCRDSITQRRQGPEHQTAGQVFQHAMTPHFAINSTEAAPRLQGSDGCVQQYCKVIAVNRMPAMGLLMADFTVVVATRTCLW